MEKCINHFIIPKNPSKSSTKGDCLICVPDELNKNCSGYTPVSITVHGFDVEDDKKEQF